ncbi:MAG: hypothetical protein AAF567_13080 [Actinomycetota bacterium]
MKKILMLAVMTALLVPAVVSFAPDEAAAARTRTLDVNWCWGATEVDPGCPVQEITLVRQGGNRTLTTVWNNTVETGTWTWDRQTKTITMSFDNHPGVTYEGQRRRGCFTGTMTNTTIGISGVWSGCYTS